MCLLDSVLRWDAEEILCQTGSHLLADNPLRAGRLGVANAIEYAAQAMAVHGALLAGDAARPRPVIWPACVKPAGIASGWMRLDTPLLVHALRLSGNDITAMYRFALHAGERLLASGRLGVVLNAAALASCIPLFLRVVMKRALITGGSGAIGAAISQRLAADGFHVIIHANSNLAAAQALCQSLRHRASAPRRAV
jgi:predicted hotdog family 3-hydroxylacyl-ACP dehydratase